MRDHESKRVTPSQPLSLMIRDHGRPRSRISPIGLTMGEAGKPRTQRVTPSQACCSHDRSPRETTDPNSVTPAQPHCAHDRRPRKSTDPSATPSQPLSLMIGVIEDHGAGPRDARQPHDRTTGDHEPGPRDTRRDCARATTDPNRATPVWPHCAHGRRPRETTNPSA